MNTAKVARQMVLAIVGLALMLGAGCVGQGNYWYEKRCWDVEPTARTLENGPYSLSYSGHATLALWDPDEGQYLTDEMRERVSNWLEIPREEVNIAHFAWWLHRMSVAQFGSQYSVKCFDGSLMPGRCFIVSSPYTDIQRQLFNWIKWKRESLYQGKNRKRLRFAYFAVARDHGEERRIPEDDIPRDIEYWVCIFDKEGTPLKTASSIALTPERVAELRVTGPAPGKGLTNVRLENRTMAMWNPNELQESDGAVIRGLLVEALNAMSEEELMRLEVE